MHTATAYITSDGQVFTDVVKAKRHAECRYANAMLPMAAQIAAIGKYKEASDWLDENLEKLAALLALREDTELAHSEEEEGND